MNMLNGSTPFGTSMDDFQTEWLRRQQVMQQNMKSTILDEINKEVSSLSTDEQELLSNLVEYQKAKATYEAGFMSFIGMKFSNEYVNTQDGRVAAEMLLNVIKQSKVSVKEQLKAKEEKVNMLLSLVDQDPEIKKRLDDIMLSKIQNV